ncbi:MAG: hypothetical protein K0U66_05880 [Gammaproteobacteria bacterium]|nr:hypothetical protein [Gammaproteobacteria bacterium]
MICLLFSFAGSASLACNLDRWDILGPKASYADFADIYVNGCSNGWAIAPRTSTRAGGAPAAISDAEKIVRELGLSHDTSEALALAGLLPCDAIREFLSFLAPTAATDCDSDDDVHAAPRAKKVAGSGGSTTAKPARKRASASSGGSVATPFNRGGVAQPTVAVDALADDTPAPVYDDLSDGELDDLAAAATKLATTVAVSHGPQSPPTPDVVPPPPLPPPPHPPPAGTLSAHMERLGLASVEALSLFLCAVILRLVSRRDDVSAPSGDRLIAIRCVMSASDLSP